MLFNSLQFVVFFLPVVLIALGLVRRSWLWTRVVFLVASYWFYMAWNPPFVLLLMGSTIVDYFVALWLDRLERPLHRRLLVTVSCVVNLSVLGFFKYGNFLVTSAFTVLPGDPPFKEFFANIVLPMGISFYTFQTMSYTIDVYRRVCPAEKSLLDFALYVTFFPQLVAGPILRAPDFLSQLKREPRGTSEDWQIAIDRIARGFFKKVVIADGLATYVDTVYANPEAYGAANQVLATYAYAFQIYCDFSGYSDIAIGLGRLFGFKFIENFRSPYIARGPSDFWERWHISLSTWLRDYLYISIGGSRGSSAKTYRNLFITMALGGLWHGAAWTFVIWGAYHGIWLIIHRAFFRGRPLRIPALVSSLVTFHLVCLGWMAFRAESIDKLAIALRNLTDFRTPVQAIPFDIGVLLAIAAASHVLGAVPRLKTAWAGSYFGVKATWYAMVIVAIFLRASSAQRFIYFQF